VNDLIGYEVWDRRAYLNTDDFFSLWRSLKPTIAKVHGYAVIGGSDRCPATWWSWPPDARIGYLPARVWGVEMVNDP
jgi:hypothetical protein